MQPRATGIKGFSTFPNVISLKENVISRLEFELAYFETADQHFSHSEYDAKKLNNSVLNSNVTHEISLMVTNFFLLRKK